MSHSPISERELLARLGLGEGASEDQVESAHNDVVAFLDNAPADLRDWARAQLATADEAYALLSDHSGKIQPERPTSAPIAPARTAPARTAQPTQPTQPAPSTRRTRAARAAQLAAADEPRQPFLRRIGPMGRIAVATVALAGVLVGAYVVYASDLPSVPGLNGTPAPDGQQATLDTARVAQLMQTIQADPKNLAALEELGDLYFSAHDYATAAEWEQKVLDIDPNNITAHLALGAALYNTGNSTDAEVHWRRVIELNPSDTEALVEAHYDLGFMYFSANPPDVEKTIVEWQAVIDIAPESDIAQTVKTHLQTLEQWNSSASPSSSGSPSASNAATPTPAATQTPAVTAQPSATAAQ